MASHPVFLIVRAKIAEAASALAHMEKVDDQQRALAFTHPTLYCADVHAESMATNVQGIFTHFEAILKSLANTIDGFTPSDESSHRDLLLQVSASDSNRGPMIGKDTLHDLTLLLKFRHAVRNNYASELRHSEVFENVCVLKKVAPTFFLDLDSFINNFENAESA